MILAVSANLNLRIAISDCEFYQSAIRDPQFDIARLTVAHQCQGGLESPKWMSKRGGLRSKLPLGKNSESD
jgi:hypothetical protein